MKHSKEIQVQKNHIDFTLGQLMSKSTQIIPEELALSVTSRVHLKSLMQEQKKKKSVLIGKSAP